jgi:adenylosuccinate lyase
MPHKRNPIGCEQIVGLARLLRGNSSVERVILPDSFIALDHMLRRFTGIVRDMVVYPQRMRENLDRSRGVVFSGTVLLELAKRGVSREDAYGWVQRNAMRSFAEQRDFKDLLLRDADVATALTPVDIDRIFSLDEHFKHVDEIFDRVFMPSASVVH